MNQFRRHMIASAILALPFALIGCNGEGDSSSSENGGGSNVSAKAPILTPVMLSQALPVNQATMIDLSSAIISGDGENYLSRLALSPRASEGCDESPVISNHKVSVTPQDGSGEVLMCSYDYTVGEGKLSATSTLAFAAVDGKTLTPSLPLLGKVGSVGEAIEVTVVADGNLNTEVIVLGDTTTAPDVDTTAKTITFTGNELGVTRVMYTVTDPTSNETKVGIIDFTVSVDINTAPTASRGDITIAKDTVTTITLSSFTQPNGSSGSLVTDRDYSGNDTGHAGLTIHNLVAPLGVELADPNTGDLSFTVKTTRPGVFPVFYSITDGDGGYASNYIWVATEGDAGLIVRDASFNLEPTTNARELTIDVADFAQVSSGVAQLSIEGTPAITNQQAPSSTGYNATVTSTGTKVTYRYAGNSKAGMSNITYQLKDAATGLLADGNIYISVGNRLPAFTANSLSVTNNNSHATPETGDTLTPTVTCDTATSCDVSKTKWVWKQSGDIVGDSEVDGEKAYTVQYFPCDDTLELWATPVGTYNDNGQIKEVEGVPVKMSWVSPDALTAHLSKASAKEGEEVTLTIKACSGTTATVGITTGLDRQNRAQTDALAKIKDGSANVTSKTVNLDANGEATLTLVAPKGGLKSTISITSGGKSATEHVTFSTITSPDVPQANRYGHMPNYEDIGGGLIWLRAQLVGETTLSSGQYTPQNGINETYVGGNTTQISSLCQSLSSSMYGLNTTQPRIPVLPEARLYRDFVVAKGYSDIVSYNGWNVWSRLGTVFTFTGVLHNYGLIMTALSSSHPDYVEPFISRSSAHQTDGWAFCVANKFVPTVTTVKNTHNFAVDSGFPTTAFDGAQFKLNMSPDNAGYSFVSSDSTNAPVDGNGVITINDKPAGEVTITASKNGEADVEYSFNVDEFYSIPLLGRAVASTEAKASCSTRGLNEPTREQLASQGVKDARQVGGLFTEWGLPQQWNGWVPPTGWIWSKTVDSSGYFCGVNAFPGEGPVYGTCVPDQPGSAWVPYCYK